MHSLKATASRLNRSLLFLDVLFVLIYAQALVFDCEWLRSMEETFMIASIVVCVLYVASRSPQARPACHAAKRAARRHGTARSSLKTLVIPRMECTSPRKVFAVCATIVSHRLATSSAPLQPPSSNSGIGLLRTRRLAQWATWPEQ